MFEDVPERLNRFILDAPDELKGPVTTPILAAIAVTQHYLGKVFLDSDEARLAATTELQSQTRVVQVSEAIFALRNEPAFPEICRRFAERDLRSVYFESSAARMFQEYGFSIHARCETGALGDDFDFEIRAPGVQANVEATSLTGRSFSATSLSNALGHKRKQLPNNAPAIIVCFLPWAWRAGVSELSQELEKIANKFLRGTRRINYVFIVEDVLIPAGEGGIYAAHFYHFRNDNPRQPSEALDGLLGLVPAADQQVRALLAAPPTERSVGVGPMFEWIDWLLSR